MWEGCGSPPVGSMESWWTEARVTAMHVLCRVIEGPDKLHYEG